MGTMNRYKIESEKFQEKLTTYLRQDNQFFDVTLASDDGQQLKAHKLVLSSGSLYFREILGKASQEMHPFIILSEVSYNELVGIIELLYSGEVSIIDESFGRFVKISKLLKVIGFVNDENPVDVLDKDENPFDAFNKDENPVDVIHKDENPVDGLNKDENPAEIQSPFKELFLQENDKEDEENIEDVEFSNTHYKTERDIGSFKCEEQAVSNLTNLPNNKEQIFGSDMEKHETELDSEPMKVQPIKIESEYSSDSLILDEDGKVMNKNLTEDDLMKRSDGLWECKICYRNFMKLDHVRKHVRIHMDTVMEACTICGKKLRQNSISAHMWNSHPPADLVCNLCEKVFTKSKPFKKHVKLRQCLNNA